MSTLNLSGIYDPSMITNTPGPVSTGISPKTMAGFGAIGSIASGIGSAWLQESNFKVQEIQAKTAARMAALQGKADILAMQKKFNYAMASNAVMSAAQGRSGGSVEAIASSAEAQLNWDEDFSEISSQIRTSGYQSQASQHKTAGKVAMIGGSLSSIAGGAMDYGTSLYKIGKEK